MGSPPRRSTSSPIPQRSLDKAANISSKLNRLKLSGISPSCQIRYAQFFERRMILQLYTQSKQHQQGLRFFEVGSPEWVELAKSEIATNPSEKVISSLKASLSNLKEEQKHLIIGEFYVAAQQPDLAFKEWEKVPLKTPVDTYGWDRLSRGRLAAQFIKQGNIEKADGLVKPILELGKTDYRVRDLFLSPIVEAYVADGLLEQALEFTEILSGLKYQGYALNTLAQAYLANGERAKALGILDRAKQISIENFDYSQKYKPATNVPTIYHKDISISYVKAGEYETALELVNSLSGVSQVNARIPVARQLFKSGQQQLSMTILQDTYGLILVLHSFV
jgi:tetratricopeptide (TPR) repeat protein